jgi:hypothetical protein
VDEDDVDLDNIAEEDTGYDEAPKKIEELNTQIEKDKTVRQIINQNIDRMDYQSFAIPTPKPVQPTINLNNLESLALSSWSTLAKINNQHIMNWLQLEKQKIDIFKNREQLNPIDFNKMINAIILQEEKYIPFFNQIPNEIKTLQNNIVNYIKHRFPFGK